MKRILENITVFVLATSLNCPPYLFHVEWYKEGLLGMAGTTKTIIYYLLTIVTLKSEQL